MCEMDVGERRASAWTIRKILIVAQYYLLYIFCEVCTWNVIFMYVGTWIYLVCFLSDAVVASFATTAEICFWTCRNVRQVELSNNSPYWYALSHISGTSAKIAFVLSHCYLLLLILPLANHIKIVKVGFGNLIIIGSSSEFRTTTFWLAPFFVEFAAFLWEKRSKLEVSQEEKGASYIWDGCLGESSFGMNRVFVGYNSHS